MVYMQQFILRVKFEWFVWNNYQEQATWIRLIYNSSMEEIFLERARRERMESNVANTIWVFLSSVLGLTDITQLSFGCYSGIHIQYLSCRKNEEKQTPKQNSLSLSAHANAWCKQTSRCKIYHLAKIKKIFGHLKLSFLYQFLFYPDHNYILCRSSLNYIFLNTARKIQVPGRSKLTALIVYNSRLKEKGRYNFHLIFFFFLLLVPKQPRSSSATYFRDNREHGFYVATHNTLGLIMKYLS